LTGNITVILRQMCLNISTELREMTVDVYCKS